MRLISFLILFFTVSVSAVAQESALVVSDTMYSTKRGFCLLSEKEGWVFKAGNVDNASDINLDTKTWTRFKPAAISAENFDKNGRFEGWFRIKVRFQNSKNFTPPGISSYRWAAMEIFANGKRVANFGQLGHSPLYFQEHQPVRSYPIPTNFQPDSTYVIAVHVVDYVSPFSSSPKLKSGESNQTILMLSSKKSTESIADFWPNHTFHSGLLSAISATLSLLFWILFGLNRKEKNLRRFAIGCTFLTILSIATALSSIKGIGYMMYTAIDTVGSFAVITYVFYIPFILAGVFGRVIPLISKILMGIFYLIVLDAAVLGSGGWILTCAGVPLAIALFYLMISWKTLKGAQWAIVFSFLISFIFLIVYVWVGNSPYTKLFVLIYTAAPPLGMLVYVSARFSEMITEIRTNAAQVLQLSEEKREQALNQQKVLEEEVHRQTAEIRSTLEDLKATQSQLIQSEKMASLGELTAGIAHEIQNPLNFVNNFSDVSIELLDEMETEINNGDLEEAKAISSDIKQNLEKINLHGKRADAIVKGMLQHSRTSSGAKEPTDINALCDEYLRLSYHGLRAKDKSFNATMKTDFDEQLEKINIIPQDIGRVVLNLLTNAFYVVNEKKQSGIANYDPTVSISTKKQDSKLEIRVSDNGNGIPQQIVDKIFQPFFTTKPTGKGTGLGLSLSYDIVTKGHGGELKVTTKEGEGTEFIISLPI